MSLPMLQVALDNQTLSHAYETTRLIAEEVDIIEVGTILCVGEGVRAVRDLKALYPHKIVLADAKIADAGKILSRMCFEANADWVTVICCADINTAKGALDVAKEFNEKVGIDGVIVTKLDGDTRGGAALSVKAVTGKPILYAGMGEKLTDLEPFYPSRMASRILGMGDVESLIEKAQNAIDDEKAKEMESRLPEVPKSPSNHFANFLLSCMGKEKTRSPFSIAGPLSQVFCLGVLSQRLNRKLVFDRDTKQITNDPEANKMLCGVPPRKGWEQYYTI